MRSRIRESARIKLLGQEPQVLASFSENRERQEASRQAEIKELRARVGELVIERDFLSKAFGR